MLITNQIDIALPQRRVADLYSNHDLLPQWSPGFQSIESLCDGTPGRLPRFRLKYTAAGKAFEEILTVLINKSPHRLCILAENRDNSLRRESTITFEGLEASSTRVIINNRFRGSKVAHLVEEDLFEYTQAFLETFKRFAEHQGL